MQETEADCIDAQQVEALLLSDAAPCRDTRSCRICLDAGLPEGDRWLCPCQCKGTMKYVHASCLDEWRKRSRRPESAMACEQCGATYRMRATRATRLLTSWWLRLVVSLLLLGILAQVLGAVVHVSLHRFAPGMFAGPHPLHLQSRAYQPEEEAVSWIHNLVDISSSRSQLRRSLDDDDDANEDEFARLGVFQPAILLQIVQGMLQRMFESVGTRYAQPYLSLHRDGFPSLVQRVVTSHKLFRCAPPTHVVPLTWTEWLWWQTTLGLAMMGLSVHFHTFSILSSIGAFRFGTPFLAVAMYPHAPHGTEGTVVWESSSSVGVLLLGLILWGIRWTWLMLWNTLARLSEWCLTHAGPGIVNYDEGEAVWPERPRVTHWLLDRVVRGHEAMRHVEDARWVWMLAQAGD